MRSRALPLLLAVVLLAAGAAPAADLEVHEVVLDNGMRVLLVPRPGHATAACGWVAKVGSVNERPGITGLAHLFEHLMFKGTRIVGTKDWPAESRLLDQLDAVRADIRREEEALAWKQALGRIPDATSPDARSDRHRELLARYDALMKEQGEIVVENEFDKIYKEAGATFMNAGTSHDWTAYFVTVPVNKLELWFWMETDRLATPVFREFYAERDVVWEERRLRTDSTPTGRLDEQFEAMFWQASPYSWPVIGWPTDLDGISRAEAMEFWAGNYSPNNIVAVVVGGIDLAEAERLARRYFGRLERSPEPPTLVRTFEPKQLAAQRLEGEADAPPSVTLRWHGVPYGHVDMAALDVLAALLAGKTGRLEKRLVREQRLATSTSSGADFRKYGGSIEVAAVAAADRELSDVEHALRAEVRRLAEEPVGDRELQKVKNQSLADRERSLSSDFFLLFTLLGLESSGTWRDMATNTEAILAVTPEDIRRVARTYFPPEGENVAVYRTKVSGAPRDPAFDALTPQQQVAARQMKAQIDKADAAQLEQALARFGAGAASAPEEMRPLLAWAQAYAQSRLAALQGAK